MIALIVVLAILLLLTVLLLLRVGIMVEYSENGFLSDLQIGPVKRHLYPRNPREKAKKGRKAKEKPEAEAAPQRQRGGRFNEFRGRYWPYIKTALERLKRKIRVDELTLHFAAGGTDPVAVALSYGGVTAAMGMIIPILEQKLIIKNRNFETSFSYELKEPYIYARLKLTAALWELIYTGVPLISMYRKSKDKSRKGEN